MNSKYSFARKGLFTAVSALALAASGVAMAGAANDNLAVSATVVTNCTITTSALAFGNYDPIVTNKASELDGTGSVTVICTNGAAATILLGQGSNADDGSTDAAPLRRMTDGTNFLSYSLFSDSGHSTVWGNDATVDVEVTGTGLEIERTVYGRLAADQNVPAGGYSDTVQATVSF